MADEIGAHGADDPGAASLDRDTLHERHAGSDLATPAQRTTCREHGVDPAPPGRHSKVGVSADLRSGPWPINGLRHAQAPPANGWYLWRGEVFPAADDAFVPLHVEHLADWCPAAERFLALPAGWRFLLAPGQVDVWFDASLLDIDD